MESFTFRVIHLRVRHKDFLMKSRASVCYVRSLAMFLKKKRKKKEKKKENIFLYIMII